MGQKTNPIGFRLVVNKDWRSKWYAEKKEFGELLVEDYKIRKALKDKLKEAAVPRIQIERATSRCRITIHSARPGVVIGRKGAEIDKIKEELSKMTGKEVYVEIAEIKKPELDAQLVAENICMQLERRVAFRRAIKRSMQVTMDMGALGIRLRVAGRLNGADIARAENAREGAVPLHTLRANIDYGFAEASTQYGVIGVKCWICRKDPAEEENERQQRRPRGEGRDNRPPRRPAAPAQNAN